MPKAVKCPLMIQHQHYIYVLRGYNPLLLSSVSQYNIEDDTWKQCTDMSVACDKGSSGVVVHEDRIKVITVDKCLMYDDDTDTWTVKQYNRLGDRINAFVSRGQIWAAVQKNVPRNKPPITRLLRYSDVVNMWKIEHKRIDNVQWTRLFC